MTIWPFISLSRKLSVPQNNRDMRKGLMMALIRQAGLTPEEFTELL